jgi:tetratricopeptide (TPR) repeat protein
MTASQNTQPFVGRTAELALLMGALEAAGGGRFSAAVISGEPGIGKSRLAEELSAYARQSGFHVVIGHCFDTHSRTSYFPFIQALRQLAQQTSPGAQQALSSKRQTKLARASDKPKAATHGRTAHQRAELISRLSRPPLCPGPLRPDSDGEQNRLFVAVTCVFRESSQNRPILIVLEDLDWADDGSLMLMLHLVRTLSSARLLLVATCCGTYRRRGSLLHRAIAELAQFRHGQRIRLKGLAESETAAVTERLLGSELSEEAKKLAISAGQAANGNPLFLNQVLQHLLETGRLFREGNQWMTTSGWESRLAAEDGVIELVDFRLSHLSERCRHALTRAAVLGEEFELDLLAQMLGGQRPQALLDSLEEARDAGILLDSKSDGNADYCFTHALIRESLYERLSRPIKRRLHADAAAAIEKIHHACLEPRLAQLALHYSRAGRAGDVVRATGYCLRAGELAYAVCDYAGAASHWHEALSLAGRTNSSLHAQILERLAEASLLTSGSLAETARYLEAALKLYRESGKQHDVARVHARLATVLSMRLVTVCSATAVTPDAVQAVSHSRRAEKLLAIRSDQAAEGELLIGEAIVAHAQFRTDDGLALTQRALDIGESLATPDIWCQAAALRGHFLLAGGKLAAGLALMAQALERTEQIRDVKPRFAAAWLSGFSDLLLWDPDAAERAIQEGLTHPDNSQAELLRHILMVHLGIAYVFSGEIVRARAMLTAAPHDFLEANVRVFEGDWVRAEDLLTRQIQRAESANSKQQHWTAGFWLARLKRLQGDYGRTIELLANTPLIAEQLLRIPEEIATRSELALAYVGQAAVADSRSQISRCRALMSGNEDWRGLAAFVARAEAALLAQSGQFEEATQQFIIAAQTFSKYRLPGEVAETLVTWGEQLIRAGRAEGVEKLNGAVEIYRHLGVGPRWQARIEQLYPPAKQMAHDGVVPHTIACSAVEDTNSNYSVASTDIYKLATTNDVALLATLIHDAIAHLMNAIDKASKLRKPIERIAEATEKISRISAPVDRLIRTLEQTARNSASGKTQSSGPRNRPGSGSYRKLNRSHDPGRPL